MKVIVVGHTVHPPWSFGGEVLSRNIAEALTQLGVEVVVTTNLDSERIAMASESELSSYSKQFNTSSIRRVHRTAFTDIMPIASAAKQTIGKFKPDIVHCVGNYNPFSLAMMKSHDSKLVVHLHLQPMLRQRNLAKTYYFFLSRTFIDLLLTTSHSISENLYPTRSYVVPPPTNTDLFRPMNDGDDEITAFAKGSEIILYMGSLSYFRFPHRAFIDAVMYMKRELRRDVRLYIIGRNRNSDYQALGQIHSYIEQIGAKDSIHAQIRILRENEKPLVYNASQVVALPLNSLTSGTVVDPPLTLLEAMACECIVATRPIHGICHVVKHLENGVLFNRIDTEGIASSLTEALDRQDIRHSARKTILENFSYPVVSELLVKAYKSQSPNL